jgi:hypothetical protein
VVAVIAAHPRRWTVGVLVAAVVGLVVFAILEGDLPELVRDGAFVVGHLLRRFGVAAAFGLLYAEESGVPMPMPGDVFVMYVGHHAAQSLLTVLGLARADHRGRSGCQQPLLDLRTLGTIHR